MSARGLGTGDPSADSATSWLPGSMNLGESALDDIEMSPDDAGLSEAARTERTDREFRLEHTDEFLEPLNQVSEPIEPFTSPEQLVERVNPDYGYGEPYESNCADCARCFERSWRGRAEEAAGRAYQLGDRPAPGGLGLVVEGEPSQMTEDWDGRPMQDLAAPQDLRRLLEERGPGSSAIVHSWWQDPEGNAFGHAYNVVNDHGAIRTVDAQTHECFDFDESAIRPGISAAGHHKVLTWDRDGRPINV